MNCHVKKIDHKAYHEGSATGDFFRSIIEKVLHFLDIFFNNDAQIGFVHLGSSDGALMGSLSDLYPENEYPFLSIFGIEINTEGIQAPFLERPPSLMCLSPT